MSDGFDGEMPDCYSCGQITSDLSDFGSSRKQPKATWKEPETVNFSIR